MAEKTPLVPGIDYYLEDGKVVFTADHHRKRGYCCNSRCRHCPYGNAPGPVPDVARIEIGGISGALSLLPILKPKGGP